MLLYLTFLGYYGLFGGYTSFAPSSETDLDFREQCYRPNSSNFQKREGLTAILILSSKRAVVISLYRDEMLASVVKSPCRGSR